MSLATSTLTTTVGIEISGVSGRQFVDRSIADECQAALDEHGVVVIRDANIDDDDLVAFTRLLGEVVVMPTGEHRHPEIQTITMDPEKANPHLAAYRKGNFFWHIDGVHDPMPQKATLLSAREVAEEGGDTEFASMYAGYDALPDDEKAGLEGLRVVHTFAAAMRRANVEGSEKERAMWERRPSRDHPLVWKHRDGRSSMLIGSTADHIAGLPADDSEALLQRLLDWTTQPQFVVRHQWRPGDLVMWDNTGMLHRAMPFEPTSPRLLHRTTLVGTEAVT
jgi:alpha-ketoglutarate-dependent taurine dioxygenase